MGFLRLGVACIVRDDDGRILLSKRNDLNVWNLPSGRLDSGENIEIAAVREVLEETGIQAEVIRTVGLYYYQGWQRMNVLFEAKPIGGELLQETFETQSNQFFAADELPSDNIDHIMVYDVLQDMKSPMRVISLPLEELFQIKLKLGWRWVKNFFHGHIESRHARFTVYGCLQDNDHHPILIDGDRPLWQQLNLTEAHTLLDIEQDIHTDTLKFTFGSYGVSI